MDVCVFHSAGWWGLTEDHEGANLPADRGPWSYLTSANLASGDGVRAGINALQAIVDIVARGHHLSAMNDQDT